MQTTGRANLVLKNSSARHQKRLCCHPTLSPSFWSRASPHLLTQCLRHQSPLIMVKLLTRRSSVTTWPLTTPLTCTSADAQNLVMTSRLGNHPLCLHQARLQIMRHHRVRPEVQKHRIQPKEEILIHRTVLPVLHHVDVQLLERLATSRRRAPLDDRDPTVTTVLANHGHHLHHIVSLHHILNHHLNLHRVTTTRDRTTFLTSPGRGPWRTINYLGYHSSSDHRRRRRPRRSTS